MTVCVRNTESVQHVRKSANPEHVPDKDIEVRVSASSPEEAQRMAVEQIDPKFEPRPRAVTLTPADPATTKAPVTETKSIKEPTTADSKSETPAGDQTESPSLADA